MTLDLKKRKMKKQYHSIDQTKLKIICDKLCDKIEDVLDHFGLEYRMNQKFVSMSCPIHNGDNDGALNLYYIGEDYKGNWKCRSHKCEEHFKSSIIGFIRGILSNRKFNWSKEGDSTVSFQEALEYAIKLADVDINSIKPASTVQKNKTHFINNTKIFSNSAPVNKTLVTRDQVKKLLNIPSSYFIDRGFTKEILEKYDVGDCLTQNKEMSHRAVVPIYDENFEYMVGCSGRSIYNKCDICKTYHTDNCPDEYNSWKYSKWKHSSGIKTQECLYNIWYAKEYIQKLGFAILVESPANVWKLEEHNIHNGLCLFGANLTDRQKMLLDTSGAMTLVIIMDSDEAGEKAREVIDKKCSRTYNIRHIRLSKNDIADMTSSEIESEIIDQIKDLL